MESTRPHIDLQILASVKYDHKWDILRPFIEWVYVTENKKVAEIRDIVKSEFGFAGRLVLPVSVAFPETNFARIIVLISIGTISTRNGV